MIAHIVDPSVKIKVGDRETGIRGTGQLSIRIGEIQALNEVVGRITKRKIEFI
jgi:hypothetical protein